MDNLPNALILDPASFVDGMSLEVFLEVYYPAVARQAVKYRVNGQYIEKANAQYMYPPVGSVVDVIYPEVFPAINWDNRQFGIVGIDSNFDHYTPYSINKIEGNTMNNFNITPVKTLTLVNGQDITRKSEHELIEDIRRMEGDVKELKGINTRSRAIEKKIGDIESALEATVKELDSRVPAEAPAAQAE